MGVGRARQRIWLGAALLVLAGLSLLVSLQLWLLALLEGCIGTVYLLFAKLELDMQ